MNTNKVRGALEAAVVYCHDNESLMDIVHEAIAELDGDDNAKDEHGGVLACGFSDDEIAIAAECYACARDGVVNTDRAIGYEDALRWCRDNGYIAPAKDSRLTVDAIVQVVKEWHLDWCDGGTANATDFDVLGANIRKVLEARTESSASNLRTTHGN